MKKKEVLKLDIFNEHYSLHLEPVSAVVGNNKFFLTLRCNEPLVLTREGLEISSKVEEYVKLEAIIMIHRTIQKNYEKKDFSREYIDKQEINDAIDEAVAEVKLDADSTDEYYEGVDAVAKYIRKKLGLR